MGNSCGPGRARGWPGSPTANSLAGTRAPLIAIEGAHVPSSGGDEIELVVCFLSPNLLKIVNGSELFGRKHREASNGLILTKKNLCSLST